VYEPGDRTHQSTDTDDGQCHTIVQSQFNSYHIKNTNYVKVNQSNKFI